MLSVGGDRDWGEGGIRETKIATQRQGEIEAKRYKDKEIQRPKELEKLCVFCTPETHLHHGGPRTCLRANV